MISCISGLWFLNIWVNKYHCLETYIKCSGELITWDWSVNDQWLIFRCLDWSPQITSSPGFWEKGSQWKWGHLEGLQDPRTALLSAPGPCDSRWRSSMAKVWCIWCGGEGMVHACAVSVGRAVRVRKTLKRSENAWLQPRSHVVNPKGPEAPTVSLDHIDKQPVWEILSIRMGEIYRSCNPSSLPQWEEKIYWFLKAKADILSTLFWENKD